jgi:hypothetical protein
MVGSARITVTARSIDGEIRIRRNALIELATFVRDLPNYSSKSLQAYLADTQSALKNMTSVVR